MTQLIHKAAPLAATLAFVVWCCWSQVHETAPLLAMEEIEPPRLERRALYPEISPPSSRDPFRAEFVDELVVVTKVDSEDPKPLFDPLVVLGSLRLDATLVGTPTPIAIINGRIYIQGQQIGLDVGHGIQCRLKSIRRDSIVVMIDNEAFEVVYWKRLGAGKRDGKASWSSPTTMRQSEECPPDTEKDTVSQVLDLMLTGANSDSTRGRLAPHAKNTGRDAESYRFSDSPLSNEDSL